MQQLNKPIQQLRCSLLFWVGSSLSHPRLIRSRFCIYELNVQYQGSMAHGDAGDGVLTLLKILSTLGCCTMGQRGGSITLGKISDPVVVFPLTARLAALCRLPHDKLLNLMNTRMVNDKFDPGVLDDLLHRFFLRIALSGRRRIP